VTVATVVPSIAAVIELPWKPSESLCQVPVPGAVTVPLASVVQSQLSSLFSSSQAPVSLKSQMVGVQPVVVPALQAHPAEDLGGAAALLEQHTRS
jgi:hypothetical protein